MKRKHHKSPKSGGAGIVKQPASKLDPIIESIFLESAYKKALLGKQFSSFWHALLRTADADPLELMQISGKSGIQYPLLAAGVDRNRKRLLLVSAEHNGRTAAIAQGDIQADQADMNVIVIRPIGVNLGTLASEIAKEAGGAIISLQNLKIGPPIFTTEQSRKSIASTIDRLFNLARVSGPVISQLVQVLEQLALVECLPIENGETDFKLSLDRLTSLDLMQQDREFGICPVPLYSFSPDELEIFLSGTDLDKCRNILKSCDVMQYFFPAPDHVALGLIDRERQLGRDELQKQLSQVPMAGHPFGPTEIVDSKASLADLVDALKARNLYVEGEQSLEITAEGQTLRRTVKFKPREGLLSKLVRRFSIKIDITALFNTPKH